MANTYIPTQFFPNTLARGWKLHWFKIHHKARSIVFNLCMCDKKFKAIKIMFYKLVDLQNIDTGRIHSLQMRARG